MVDAVTDRFRRGYCKIAIRGVDHAAWPVEEDVTSLAASEWERQQFGKTWIVAPATVQTLCAALKCRTSEEVLSVAKRMAKNSCSGAKRPNEPVASRVEYVVNDEGLMDLATVTLDVLLAKSAYNIGRFPEKRVYWQPRGAL